MNKNVSKNDTGQGILVKLSAVLFGIFSMILFYLWINHPAYGNYWFLIYSLGCAYSTLSIFIKQVPLTPTLIISVWVMLEQTKVIADKPINAILTVAITLPIFFYAWKRRKM